MHYPQLFFFYFPFRETVDFIELLQDPEADLSSVNPLPQSEAFIDFLRKRALDESVYVRKNALQVLENILRFYASQSQDLEHLALELVGILGEHCRDPSVMVRKQIASSLTEIVKAYPDNDTVVHHWVEGKIVKIYSIIHLLQQSFFNFFFGIFDEFFKNHQIWEKIKKKISFNLCSIHFLNLVSGTQSLKIKLFEFFLNFRCLSFDLGRGTKGC